LSDLDRALWEDLIRRRLGLAFSAARLRILHQALLARRQARRLATFNDYYHLVAYAKDGPEEWQALQALLVNHETCFFRHAASFAALADPVLPQRVRDRRAAGETALHLWSAGCSTGQEAYSLAMAALDAGASGDWTVQVLGTDVSPRALERARLGRYRGYEARGPTDARRERFLRPVRDGRQEWLEVAPEVRGLVRFAPFNFRDETTYPAGEQDIIFCQNVLIYFHPEDRAAVVRQLCRRLAVGGFLFLGPGEVAGLSVPDAVPVPLGDAQPYRRVH
jgi:chemotaxis methyl-accepting protein methylase